MIVTAEPYLFCGDFSDAAAFDGTLICVLEHMPSKRCFWIPIILLEKNQIITQRKQLEVVCRVIEDEIAHQREVLVHCAAGLERSPLVLAYWLTTRHKISFDDAYQLLQDQNKKIQDRRHWIQ